MENKKWTIANTFDTPRPWSGGKIVGTLKFVKKRQQLSYHHFDGKDEVKRSWKTSNFQSESEAYSHYYTEVYEYCKAGGFLLNETRLIAPGLIEMKVDSTTTIFDSWMLDTVSSSTWHIQKPRSRKALTYVECRTGGRRLLLHQLLYDLQQRSLVKHLDGDVLNNLASNLQPKTKKTIPKRIRTTGHSSGISGVFRERRRMNVEYWTAAWREPDGTDHRRRFRIKNGNDAECKRKAILTRTLAKEEFSDGDSAAIINICT